MTARPWEAVVASAAMSAAVAFAVSATATGLLRLWFDVPTFTPVVIAAGVAARGLGVSMELSDRGIRVRNVWRNYFVKWSEVAEVGWTHYWWSPLAVFTPLSTVAVTTTDGRRIVVQAGVGPKSTLELMRLLSEHAPPSIETRVVVPVRSR